MVFRQYFTKNPKKIIVTIIRMARSKRIFKKTLKRVKKTRKTRKSRKNKSIKRIRSKRGGEEVYDPRKVGVALPGLANFKPLKNTSDCVKTVWNEDNEYYYENAKSGEFYKEKEECVNNL